MKNYAKYVTVLLLVWATVTSGAPTYPATIYNRAGTNVVVLISSPASVEWFPVGTSEARFEVGAVVSDYAGNLLLDGSQGVTNSVALTAYLTSPVPALSWQIDVFPAENKLGTVDWYWMAWGFGIVLTWQGVALVVRVVAKIGHASPEL